MKTIALFGAAGKTGQYFLEAALAKGYTVKALVRNPTKLQTSPHLEIIKGDVLNSADIIVTLANCDIVVSLFGHVKDSPEWLQTNGTKNILNAMSKNNITRIISLSGGGLPFPEKDQPKFIDYLIRGIMKLAVPKILNDAIAHHALLKASAMKWVIVRGPRLTQDNRQGNCQVTWVGLNRSTKISRADLADFILTQVEDEQYNYQMPFICQ